MDACHANVSKETVIVWIMLLQLASEKETKHILCCSTFNISSVTFIQG